MLRATLQWATSPWPVRFLIGVGFCLLAGFGFSVLLSPPADRLQDLLRFAGLFLQVLGIGTIVAGVQAKSNAFELGRAVERFSEWWKAAPFRSQKAQVVGVGGIAAASSSVEGYGTVTIPPNVTLEERIKLLEDRVSGIEAEARTARRESRAFVEVLRKADESERAAREKGDAEILEKMKNISVGGIDIEWRGVLWILLGVIFATIPQEIARLWQ